MKLIITALFLWPVFIFAQNSSIPTVRTSSDSLIMYLDGEKDEFNGVNALGKKFDYNFIVHKDSVKFNLVSKNDSITLILELEKPKKFQIVRELMRDTVTCVFTIQKFVKPANFTDEYKALNFGKTKVEIPEVYELMNVVFALTDYGKTGAIDKSTGYYKKVIDHFKPYKQSSIVKIVDSLLKFAPEYFYPHLKMDSYAYVFSSNNIINEGIYDRVAPGERNEVKPYIPLLEKFAEISNFRIFYLNNLKYYSSLEENFKTEVNTSQMKIWLEKHFPSTSYSAVKVIFSPLVGWNQSASQFSDNGFTETQAHINYPFIDIQDKQLSADMLKGQRMKIAFTEINHAYLNPEAEKHLAAINVALNDLSKWTTINTPSSNYNTPLACFEEYMNYGLVTLYYSDLFDKKTFGSLMINVEKSMIESRGFKRFGEFNKEILRLYRDRKHGQNIESLYPALIDWFRLYKLPVR